MKSTVFSKDFSNTTPLTLAISGEIDDTDCLEIVRLLLKNSKLDKDCYDFERNSPLHLAVKYNKHGVVKFLVDEIKISLEECNIDGQSPFSIAQQNNNPQMINYLKHFEKTAPNIDDLLEFIESDTKKRKTKGKKTKNEKVAGLLHSTDYQDSVRTKPVTVKKPQDEKQSPSFEKENIEQPKATFDEVKSSENPNSEMLEHKVINIDKTQYDAYKQKEKLLKERKEKELLLQEQQQKAKDLEKNKKPKAERKEIKGNYYFYKELVANEIVKTKAAVDEIKKEKQEPITITEMTNTLQSEKPRANIIGLKPKIKDHKKSLDVKETEVINIKIESPVKPVNIISNEIVSIIDKDITSKDKDSLSIRHQLEEIINESSSKTDEKKDIFIEKTQRIEEVSCKANLDTVNQIKELAVNFIIILDEEQRIRDKI